MDCKTRTTILCRMPLGEILEISQEIKELADVQVIKEPKASLIMMRAKESVQQIIFNVGEVLVSESTVSVDGTIGYGVVMGDEGAKAEAVALIDAVFRSEHSKWQDVKRNITIFLKERQELLQQEKRQEFNLIARSAVSFEIMDKREEDVN
ncbi:MAG: phosphonate C-P lyase system protein PhnG [Bacillota bacterium]